MMKRLLILTLFAAISHALMAQDSIPASAVRLQKHCGLNRFYVDSARVSIDRLITGCGANEPAADMFGKAQESMFFGKLFCAVGGVLAVYPLVSMIWDDSPNIPMSVAGCCMAAISVPIFINYNRQSREALRLMGTEYVPPKDDDASATVNFGVTGNGVGFCVRF